MMSFYKYPKIYVEEGKLTRPQEAIFELADGTLCVVSKENLREISNYKRVFLKKIYETAYEDVIDLEQAKTKKAFITYSPKYDTYYLVEKNVKVGLMEIEGLKVFLGIDEGDIVREGNKIGYQVTRKYEVRNIVCIVEGTVVYIGTIFDEIQRYLIVTVGDENVRKIRITYCK